MGFIEEPKNNCSNCQHSWLTLKKGWPCWPCIFNSGEARFPHWTPVNKHFNIKAQGGKREDY